MASFDEKIARSGLETGGNIYHVKPYSGSNSVPGRKPEEALKTLSAALTLARADKGDTIYLHAESNSAGQTTDYQSSTLTISKDGLRIIGINSGSMFTPRSRIAQTSTATDVSPLVDITADNLYMEGIHVFQGVDDDGSLVAVRISGSRNVFKRCHFAGIGHATQAGEAGARTLVLDGCQETLFEECVIGLDTISRSTAAAEIELNATANANTRVIFRNCVFPTMAGGAGFLFLNAVGNSDVDRFMLFENCTFINADNSTATTMTGAFDVSGSLSGHIIVKDCMLVGASDWEAADSTKVKLLGNTTDDAADIAGIGIAQNLDVTA